MFKEALQIGLSVVMYNHTYVFDSTIRRQDEEGAIGLDLTSTLAQVFIMWCDREVKRRLLDLSISSRLYGRYLNDIDLALEVPEKGARYVSGRIQIIEQSIAEDSVIEYDRRTMLLFPQIGNSIHPSI